MTAVASETWGLVFWQEEGDATSSHRRAREPHVRRARPAGGELRRHPVHRGHVTADRRYDLARRRRDPATRRGIPQLLARRAALADPGCRRRRTARGSLRSARCARPRPGRDRGAAGRPIGTESAHGGAPVPRGNRVARGAVAQIERVRTAAGMLAAGAAVDDVVEKLGYYDEPHLARMLRRYVGRSAQQLRAGAGGAIALDPAQYTTS